MPQLQKEINHPIINLKKEVQKKLKKENVNVFVLGTPLTINKLYNFPPFTKKPSLKEQKELCDAIFLFNKGFEKNKQIKKVETICKNNLNKKINTVLIGCTEFSTMLNKSKFNKIDTMDILIDKIVKKIAKEKIKKDKGVK